MQIFFPSFHAPVVAALSSVASPFQPAL